MSEGYVSGNERWNRSLNIVFVTATDLPEGGGGTSRLKSLIQALSFDGHSILILNEHALGVSPQMAQRPIGTVPGAQYEYVLGTVERRYGFGALTEKCKAVAVI